MLQRKANYTHVYNSLMLALLSKFVRWLRPDGVRALDFLRFSQPWRGWIVLMSGRIWRNDNTPEWLLNWLYPDDLLVGFTEPANG